MGTPIALEEWDFREVPESRRIEACIWEYSREQEWIKDAVTCEGRPLNRSEAYRPGAEQVNPWFQRCKYAESPSVIRSDWCPRPAKKRKGGKCEKAVEAMSSSGPVNIAELSGQSGFQSAKDPEPSEKRIILRFSSGFPEVPYLKAIDPVATIEHVEQIHQSGIGFLEENHLWGVVRKDSVFWRFQLNNSLIAEEKRRKNEPAEESCAAKPPHPPAPGNISFLKRVKEKPPAPELDDLNVSLSEENGIEANQHPYIIKGWRKCTLFIDFSRTNEKLMKNFDKFLEKFRKENQLPPAPKRLVPTRYGIPSWLTKRFAEDSLDKLGALRVIRAFGGDVNAAYKYIKKTVGGFPASTPTVLKRSASGVDETAEKMFGKGFLRLRA